MFIMSGVRCGGPGRPYQLYSAGRLQQGGPSQSEACRPSNGGSEKLGSAHAKWESVGAPCNTALHQIQWLGQGMPSGFLEGTSAW